MLHGAAKKKKKKRKERFLQTQLRKGLNHLGICYLCFKRFLKSYALGIISRCCHDWSVSCDVILYLKKLSISFEKLVFKSN